MNDFLQKLKKVVRIVLYGPAISQSDCRKAGPYQLAYNNAVVLHGKRSKYCMEAPEEGCVLSFQLENKRTFSLEVDEKIYRSVFKVS